MRYTDPDGRIKVKVDSEKPAVVVVFSGRKNSAGAMTGTAYIFSADETYFGEIDTENCSCKVPVVSGGDKNAKPTPDGVYKNVNTVPCKQSQQSSTLLTNDDHGGKNSNYMPLGISDGYAAGDAVHQANNKVAPGAARTAGCIGVTGQPGKTDNAQNNYSKLDSVVNGQYATVIVKTQSTLTNGGMSTDPDER